MAHKKEDSSKHVVVWILGAFCGLIGAWIAGHLDNTVGVSELGYLFGFLVAFLLFVAMGWMWISVSVAVRD